MLLAHTAQASGPHTEYLVLAGAFLVLGIVLFVQKTVKPVVSVGIVLIAVALGSGAFIFAESAQTPTGVWVVIQEPKPGVPVPANKEFAVEAAVNGAQLASCNSCSDGGHLHVNVDGETIAMTTAKEPKVKLEEGEHTLTVELVDEKHVPYDPPVKDSIDVVAQ